MKNYTLEIIVFVAGALVLVLEVVGSRVFAPYLGSSIITWTSLIGVILASLSIGYWRGGVLADRKTPSYATLSFILLIAALFIAATAFIQSLILVLIGYFIRDIRIASVLAAGVLFAPASIVLGMISPYAVKLKTHYESTLGRTVGSLSALSTAGSIAGTFLAGFFLIPLMGTENILIALALVCGALALLAYGRSGKRWFMVVSIAVVLIPASIVGRLYPPSGIRDRDTLYHRVFIIDTLDAPTRRPVRTLQTEARTSQSAIFLDTDDRADFVHEYLAFYSLADYFRPAGKTHGASPLGPSLVLMIGGGAYTYPQAYLKKYPAALVDVVEIDPGMTRLAQQYFGLKENPRLAIFHTDGRVFLNNNTKIYDTIFLDALRSIYSVPEQLVTVEAVRHIRASLSPDGVVLVNIVSPLGGEGSEFFHALYRTYRSVFPHVSVFAVKNPDDARVLQNIILVATSADPLPSPEDTEKFGALLKHQWKGPIAGDAPLLTDDFAPVEYYLRENVLN